MVNRNGWRLARRPALPRRCRAARKGERVAFTGGSTACYV